jgi:predicted permease
MQPKHSFLSKNLFWLVIPAAILIGLALSLLDGQADWLRGWLAYSVLCLAGLGTLLGFARLLGQDRQALSPAFTAFAVRLVVGVILTLLLPVAGYADNKAMQAGYMFKDAQYRDGQAWKLAASDQPLSAAFSGEYNSDQYGGMLWASAGLYRLLSPEAHRQMLVILLAAVVAAIGVLFLQKAASRWFGPKIGLLSAWIMALYPEAVLLGSSQMREPFVIAGIAITLYGLIEIPPTSAPAR